MRGFLTRSPLRDKVTQATPRNSAKIRETACEGLMASVRSFLPLALPLGATLLVGACDSGQSPPSRPELPADAGNHEGGNLAPLDLVYVCGNKFLATNATRSSVHLTYRVVGTSETGSITLPPGPVEDPGPQRDRAGDHEEGDRGAVPGRRAGGAAEQLKGRPCGAPAVASAALVRELGRRGQLDRSVPLAGRGDASAACCPPARCSPGDSPEHRRSGIRQPVNSPRSPSPAELFCSGHTFLPDGRLLVAGGHIASDRGIPDISIFSPARRTGPRPPRCAAAGGIPPTRCSPTARS